MRDLIDRWKARAVVQREMGNHNAASVIDQMVRDIELRVAKLAEGLGEPTGEGWYFVGTSAIPHWVSRVRDEWRYCEGLWVCRQRVWPVVDPRKGGA